MDNPDDIPCMWDEGQCKSVCSQFSPPEVLEQPLEDYRQQCITHKFYPTGDVHSVTFPNYNSDNEEITDNYYNESYCTWDGFECHNSIPCKYAQHVRLRNNCHRFVE